MTTFRPGPAALAALLSLISHQALAGWVHQKGEDDPFKGGSEHLAVTFDMGYLAGFRCSSDADLALIFVLVEKPGSPQELAVMRALQAKLLVVVDEAPKIELSATIDTTPDGSQYRVSSIQTEVRQIVAAVLAAKKRFALALEIGGNIADSRSFAVAGSKKAVSRLASGCKLTS